MHWIENVHPYGNKMTYIINVTCHIFEQWRRIRVWLNRLNQVYNAMVCYDRLLDNIRNNLKTRMIYATFSYFELESWAWAHNPTDVGG